MPAHASGSTTSGIAEPGVKTTGMALVWNGSAWVNSTLGAAGIAASAVGTTQLGAKVVTAAKIADATIADLQVAANAAIQLSKLGQSGASVGQVPQWDGTKWTPGSVQQPGPTIPNVLLPEDEGAVLTVHNGVIEWVNPSNVAAGGIVPFSPGGGRAQGGFFFPDNPNKIVCVGDQGGRAVNRTLLGLAPWFPTNHTLIDQNNDRTYSGAWPHPTIAGKGYALCDGNSAQSLSGLWRTFDYGETWVRDAATATPTHPQAQPGGAADDNPRAIGRLGCINASGGEICADSDRPRRLPAAATTWDDMSFPRTDGKPLCIFNNPNNFDEVWCIYGVGPSGSYATFIYRCPNASAATPTWTLMSGFNSGTTGYAQEGRHTGTNVIVISVNPFAVSGKHGIYTLDNASSAAFGAAWVQIGPQQTIGGVPTFFPIRTSLVIANSGGNYVSNLFVEKIGTKWYCGVTCGGVNNADPASTTNPRAAFIFGVSNTGFTAADRGTWKAVGALAGTHTNLINNQPNEPWNRIDPGQPQAFWASTGLMNAAIHPTNPDIVVAFGRQGAYICYNMTAPSPIFYPMSYGIGGPVVPDGCFDPLNRDKVYGGLSDEFMFPAGDGGVDPGNNLKVSIPTAQANQIHGCLIRCIDGYVVVASGDYSTANKYGVFVHTGLDTSGGLPGTWGATFPDDLAGDDADGWVNLAFADGGTTPGNATQYMGLLLDRHTDGQYIILAAQGVAGTGPVGFQRKKATWANMRITATTVPGGIGAAPSGFACFAKVKQADGHYALYKDGAGLLVSSDYGVNWTTILAGVIPAVATTPFNLRNYAGFVAFKRNDSSQLIVANDTGIWIVNDPFGTPAAYAIGASVITRPGPVGVSDLGMHVVQRQSSTQGSKVYRAPFPTQIPPTPPAWEAYPDVDGRISGQGSFARDIVCYANGDWILSSQGGGSIIWREAA